VLTADDSEYRTVLYTRVYGVYATGTAALTDRFSVEVGCYVEVRIVLIKKGVSDCSSHQEKLRRCQRSKECMERFMRGQ
jgi:hypothetical protein